MSCISIQLILFISLLVTITEVCRCVTSTISEFETIEHDSACFTQGLILNGSTLYESCGLYGKSSLRIVDSSTGRVVIKKVIHKRHFAEGIVLYNGKIYMLTWKSKVVLIFDSTTLDQIGSLQFQTFRGEGWGFTSDGRHLVASDGSSKLTYFNLPTGTGGETALTVWKHQEITDAVTGKPVTQINELQYAEGFLFANLWYQDEIIRIDPATGSVVQRYDLSHLYPHSQRAPTADCLNGIAYDARDGSFLLTGKKWPLYYKVRLPIEGGGKGKDSGGEGVRDARGGSGGQRGNERSGGHVPVGKKGSNRRAHAGTVGAGRGLAAQLGEEEGAAEGTMEPNREWPAEEPAEKQHVVTADAWDI